MCQNSNAKRLEKCLTYGAKCAILFVVVRDAWLMTKRGFSVKTKRGEHFGENGRGHKPLRIMCF